MKKLTLVIADDEPLSLKSEELLIKKEFPNVDIVALAEDGIEFKLAVEKYEPDMAIVDINMPGLSGLEAIELLRKKATHTHFLICTAYSDVEYLKTALDLHTDGYLIKPGRRDETIETIAKMCHTVEREMEQVSEEVQNVLQVVNPFFGSEILMSIFSKDPDKESFDTYCKLNHIDFSSGCIIRFLPESGDVPARKEILQNISTVLEGICSFLATVNVHELIVMLFLPREIGQDKLKTWCGEITELIADGLEKSGETSYIYSIGNIYNTFDQMRDSYRESLEHTNDNSASEGFYRDLVEKKGDYVSRAKDYIHIHYTEDISLNDCAEHVGISQYYLSRIFKECLGYNFVEYLSMVRIDAAKRLCEDKSLSIRDIAQKCGYANITYFYRVFKRSIGVTIGEYRREISNVEDE